MGKQVDQPALGLGTSSGGPNYVDYLTESHSITTHDLAISGSVVAQSYVGSKATNDVWHQVHADFIPHYTKNNAASGWDPARTLFSIFIGINDNRADYTSNAAATNAHIFNEYHNLLNEVSHTDAFSCPTNPLLYLPQPQPNNPTKANETSKCQLYATGARNFLLINVPPINLSPDFMSRGANAQKQVAAAIADWNGRVTGLAGSFSGQHPDTSVFAFDSHKLFSEILANPASHKETAGIKKTTSFCQAYTAPSRPAFVSSCGVGIAEYFWFNSLHPSFTVHRALAAEIAAALQ